MTSFALHSVPVLPSRPRLAFVETASDVRIALDAWETRRLDGIVALAPEAAWALREAGRLFLALEDGSDPRLIRDLADPAVERQQAWSERIDDWLGRQIPAFRGEGFQPARLHLHPLKIMFDSVAIRVFLLKWALMKWAPSFVWNVASESDDPATRSDLSFSASLYPPVIRAVARHLNIEAVIGGASTGPGAPATDLSIVSGRVLRRRAVAARATFRRFLRRSRESAPAAGTLVISATYDLSAVWNEVLRSGLGVESWESVVAGARNDETSVGPDVATCMRAIWSAAVDQAGLLDAGVVDGCDVTSLIESRMRFWWDTLVPAQWRAFMSIRRQRADRRPRAVAVAILGDHIERGVFDALRSLGVASYIYQHGGFVGPCECPPWDCSDLRLADCELTYGTGTTAYFEERGRRYSDGRALPTSVGSSRLDFWQGKIRRGRPTAARPRVLLVPNLLPGNNRYFDAGTTPDVLEAELQGCVVAIAREYPNCSFTFKAFPQFDQSVTPALKLAGLRGSNCRVKTRGSLAGLLAECDLAVLLFPSTALLEALLTDRPVLVLVDPRYLKMRPDARAMLERRAIVAESPEEFLMQYRRILAEGKFGPLPAADDSFLHSYGTYLNDGRSALRAFEAISSARTGAPLTASDRRAVART